VFLDQLRHKYRTTGLAAALSFILTACDQTVATNDIDPVPPEFMQGAGREQQSLPLLEPQRYLRLSDLAAAIRQAGHACQKVRAYKSVQNDEAAIYKVDCLAYSYRLTVIDGRSHIERWTG
jgi:hypothetical protein